ncbi:hypothetical protein EMIT0196MI5_210018 [Pseudomonas sp. IT-196MI5]
MLVASPAREYCDTRRLSATTVNDLRIRQTFRNTQEQKSLLVRNSQVNRYSTVHEFGSTNL